MARRNKTVVLAGPWKGMEERENLQEDAHCQLALNVDFSRGYIESRKGFTALTNDLLALYPKMHVVKKDGKPHRIISLGMTGATGGGLFKGNILYQEWDLDGNNLRTRDMTLRDGHPHDDDFDCSFLDAFISRIGDSGNRDQAHSVTLIVTRHTTYMYDPARGTESIYPVDMENDSIRFLDKQFAYWDSPPACAVAVEHKSYYVYGGFRDGFGARMHKAITNTQSLGSENLIEQVQRSTAFFGPHHFVISDTADPLGIPSWKTYSCDNGETIIGMASYMEQLIVFTDASIYSLTGGSSETFAFYKVASGIGCIAKNSIVEVNDILYFMSDDGIYAYQGMGPESVVVNISKSIGSTFTHRNASTQFNSAVAQTFRTMGVPFRADMGLCRKSHALHVQSLNQIWWSLPCTQNKTLAAWTFPTIGDVVLVFDYAAQAWSFHVASGRKQGSAAAAGATALMYSGVRFLRGGKEEIITGGRWQTEVGGYLYKYGGSYDGRSAAKGTIDMVYITGRLFRQNADPVLFRPIRLKLLSNTSKTDSGGWFVEGEEAHGDAQYVKADGTVADTAAADRQGTSGLLDLHPEPGGNAFYDTGTWGGTGAKPFKWASKDWYTSKIESSSVRSRSLRLGLRSTEDYNPNVLTVQSIQVEVEGGDSR